MILCPHREAYLDIVVVALDGDGQQRSSSFQVRPDVTETTDEAAIRPCEPPIPCKTHSCPPLQASINYLGTACNTNYTCPYVLFLLQEIDCDSEILSSGAVAGIAVTISVLAALPVGILIGCCGVWCVKRWGKKHQQLQEATYEEPAAAGTAIPLSDNLAYGHVNRQRGN